MSKIIRTEPPYNDEFIELYYETMEVYDKKRCIRVALTGTQFSILSYLVSKSNICLSREDIGIKVDFDGDAKWHISNLKKILPYIPIITIRTKAYLYKSNNNIIFKITKFDTESILLKENNDMKDLLKEVLEFNISNLVWPSIA